MQENPARGGRPAKGEPVLERAFRLLDAFGSEERTLTLTEISERCDIPLTSTLRITRQLASVGALQRLANGSYTVGPKMLRYATFAPHGHGLRAISLPYMEDLHSATRQHVQLILADGDEAVLAELLSWPGAGRVLFGVGARLALHRSASGLVILAHMPPEFISAYLSKPLRGEPGSTTLTDPDELRRHLAEVRSAGRAWFSRSEPEPAESVAAPIFDHTGSCVAALSVLGAVGSIDLRWAEQAVVAIARVISRAVSTAKITAEPR